MRREVLLITFIMVIFLLNKVCGMIYLDSNAHLIFFVPEVVTLPISSEELSNKFVGSCDSFWFSNYKAPSYKRYF